jgi:RNA polymerase sigma-70 factor, ECF subfamily
MVLARVVGERGSRGVFACNVSAQPTGEATVHATRSTKRRSGRHASRASEAAALPRALARIDGSNSQPAIRSVRMRSGSSGVYEWTASGRPARRQVGLRDSRPYTPAQRALVKVESMNCQTNSSAPVLLVEDATTHDEEARASEVARGEPGPGGAQAPAGSAESSDLDTIITMCLPILRARSRELCRGVLDPEDVVQDAIVRALQARQQLRERSRARAWLLAILYRTFIDKIRQRRRHVELMSGLQPDDVAADGLTAPVPWHHISDDDLRTAVAQLPGDLQVTYRMFALEGRPYAEIAVAMRIPPATVGTRIYRSRKRLQRFLAARAAKALFSSSAEAPWGVRP